MSVIITALGTVRDVPPSSTMLLLECSTHIKRLLFLWCVFCFYGAFSSYNENLHILLEIKYFGHLLNKDLLELQFWIEEIYMQGN